MVRTVPVPEGTKHWIEDHCRSNIQVDDHPHELPNPETFVRGMARQHREGNIEDKCFCDLEVERFISTCVPLPVRQAYLNLYTELKEK